MTSIEKALSQELAKRARDRQRAIVKKFVESRPEEERWDCILGAMITAYYWKKLFFVHAVGLAIVSGLFLGYALMQL